MEFARKFRLVPADGDQKFADEHLSYLDKKIQTIFKTKLRNVEKARLYTQILQKFVSFSDVNSVKTNDDELLPEKFPQKFGHVAVP